MAATQKKPEGMTVSRFAAMMNCDRHELARKVEELRADPIGEKNGGQVFAMRDLILAFAGGDERAERIRRTRAEAERLEIQNERSKGQLVEVTKVKRAGESVLVAVRNKILNMPLTDDEKDKCLSDLLSLRDIDFTD